MIKAIHHIQITVPEDKVEAAREFYLAKLGLPEIPKSEALRKNGGFWMELEGLQIHVGTEEGVDRTKTKAHVAYQATDISFWKEKLQSMGIEATEGTGIPNCSRLEFRDPFGNRVEFIQLN